MTDLPAGWAEVALGDVCEIVMGQAPKGTTYNDRAEGWPLIAGAGDFDGDAPRAKKFTTAPTRLSAPGDIVLGIRASIGAKVLADGEYCLGRGVAALRASKGLDRRFLWHWLTSSSPALAAKGRGATFLQVNRSDIAEMALPLPPLEEQRRIAAILDKADELRAKRRAALDKLESLTQSIFLDMFGDPVRNPNGWPIAQIGDVTSSATYGTAQKATSEGAVPVLRMGNLTATGTIDTTDLKFLTHAEEKHLLRNGDVLFNRTNSADLVGKTAVFRLPGEWAYAGYLIRLRLTAKALPDFVGTYMNLPTTKQRLRSMCRAIVGQANINAKELQRIPMPLPPRGLQDDFARRLEAVELAKRQGSSGVHGLDRLFSSLQSRAFRGEL